VRILVLAEDRAVNSNYRAFHLIALAQRDHVLHFFSDLGDLRRPLRHFDVAFIYRFHERDTAAFARRCQAAGLAVVWDCDDDLTTCPTGSGIEKKKDALRSQRTRSELVRMMDVVDLVTTTSPLLADYYQQYGAESVRVIENYLPHTFAAARRRTDDDVVIGWTAGQEHRYDLEHLHLRGVLSEVLATHSNVRVETIGVDARLPSPRYHHTDRVQYNDLAGRVAQWDIGIAPIADIPFNRARSNVKLKEYAAVGVPWLASPIGPYVGHGTSQGGRLVADDEWRRALDALVRNARARRRLAKRGLKWATRQTILVNLEQWERAFADARELANLRPRTAAG
jgi:hypothetical protein